MIKILENRIYELAALTVFASLGIFHFLTKIGGAITGITLAIIGLYYLTKMFVSFRHWKVSKGASLINAHINFMLFVAIFGIGYTFLSLPGGNELIYSCLLIPQYSAVIFGIVLLIRRKKYDQYWSLIRNNTMKWAASIILCALFFYLLDIPSFLIENGQPSKGWIKLY